MTPRSTTTNARRQRGNVPPPAVAGQEAGKVTPRRVRTGQRSAAAISDDERQRQIAEAAYYIAERRGFAPGGEFDDWLEAETEVDRRLGGGGAGASGS